jgi:hypothetical protein
VTEPQLTLCDSMPVILRRSLQERQAESYAERRRNLSNLHKRKVTELLPAQYADVLPAFKREHRASERVAEKFQNVRCSKQATSVEDFESTSDRKCNPAT